MRRFSIGFISIRVLSLALIASSNSDSVSFGQMAIAADSQTTANPASALDLQHKKLLDDVEAEWNRSTAELDKLTPDEKIENLRFLRLQLRHFQLFSSTLSSPLKSRLKPEYQDALFVIQSLYEAKLLNAPASDLGPYCESALQAFVRTISDSMTDQNPLQVSEKDLTVGQAWVHGRLKSICQKSK